MRPVGGRDAGGYALARFNGLGKRRAEARRVLLSHGEEPQIIRALLGQRHANQSPPMLGHEIDRFRRHKLGGQGQVAFVFTVFVIDNNDHAAGTNFGQGAGYISKWGF